MRTRHFEIVRVVDDVNLFDSESCLRDYRRTGGRALAAGHYVVTWPTAVAAAVFDDGAEFIGPFESMLAAERALCEVGLGAAYARLVA
jgi:hypothetical protein